MQLHDLEIECDIVVLSIGWVPHFSPWYYEAFLIKDFVKWAWFWFMTLFYDNNASIEIAKNVVQHNGTKYIELDKNYKCLCH